jgi:hypothetical protein
MESNPIEQIEVQKALDLKAELEAIPYGDMKKEFIALGIGEAFTPGTKKETLVAIAIAALEKLDTIANIETGLGLEPSAEVIAAVAEVVEVVEVVEVAEIAETIVPEEVGELVKPIYSREVILENLHNIRLAIPNSIDIHKIVLVGKQDMLVKMLKDLDEWEKIQG